LEYLLQLNDGPLKGVELTLGHPIGSRIRRLTLHVTSPRHEHDTEDVCVLSANYDLYVEEPSANRDGSVLCFYHDRSTMLPKHPLAKIRRYMSENDRKRWDAWIHDVSHGLEICYANLSPGRRRWSPIAEGYQTAKRKLNEIPNLSQ
jgi:hypothetical protein